MQVDVAAAIREVKRMLRFEEKIAATDSDAAVYVFFDKEKGHTVYLSHTGMLTVVEDDKPKNKSARAVGFSAGGSDCSSCDGC
jgi:hypothetical protein